MYITLWPCPMSGGALPRAKVRRVVCGARSFRYVYELMFEPSQLEESGPTTEQGCKDIYVRRLKRRGLDVILDYEGL